MNAIMEPKEWVVFPDPENPLNIKLPVFEGPLDLLLHLCKKKEVSVSEVNLSDLTGTYLSYLELMKDINLEFAGEFLEIAATLILIKSRSLLPKPPPPDIEDQEEADPEEQLKQRLLEYQRFKSAAFELSSLDMLGRDVFSHPTEPLPTPQNNEPVFEEVSLYSLMDAFRQVLIRSPKLNAHIIEMENYTIEDRIESIITMLKDNGQVLFAHLFPEAPSRAYLVISFMALLELAKMKMIQIKQNDLFSEIKLCRNKDFERIADQWYRENFESERFIA